MDLEILLFWVYFAYAFVLLRKIWAFELICLLFFEMASLLLI